MTTSVTRGGLLAAALTALLSSYPRLVAKDLAEGITRLSLRAAPPG